MEPDLCPPYWPSIIWWLIHHPHGPDPDTQIDRQLITRLDTHFAAIAVSALAGRLGDKRVGEDIGKLVGPLASNPMPAFHR